MRERAQAAVLTHQQHACIAGAYFDDRAPATSTGVAR
jgi:hypothetical protein